MRKVGLFGDPRAAVMFDEKANTYLKTKHSASTPSKAPSSRLGFVSRPETYQSNYEIKFTGLVPWFYMNTGLVKVIKITTKRVSSLFHIYLF